MFACHRREALRPEPFPPDEDPGEVPEMTVRFGGTK